MRSYANAPVAERVKDYSRIGFWIGLGLSAYAIVLFLIRGSKPFDALETSVVTVCLAYLFGGVLGGAIYGLLEPFTSTFIGSVIVGGLTASPFSFLLGFTFIPPEKFASHLIPISLSMALTWSILGSVIAWIDRDR
jgi:hypothetical protein